MSKSKQINERLIPKLDTAHVLSVINKERKYET